MVNNSSHQIWASDVVLKLKNIPLDDSDKLVDVLLGASDYFQTLNSRQKTDILLMLLGEAVRDGNEAFFEYLQAIIEEGQSG